MTPLKYLRAELATKLCEAFTDRCSAHDSDFSETATELRRLIAQIRALDLAVQGMTAEWVNSVCEAAERNERAAVVAYLRKSDQTRWMQICAIERGEHRK